MNFVKKYNTFIHILISMASVLIALLINQYIVFDIEPNIKIGIIVGLAVIINYVLRILLKLATPKMRDYDARR